MAFNVKTRDNRFYTIEKFDEGGFVGRVLALKQGDRVTVIRGSLMLSAAEVRKQVGIL